PPKVGAVLFRGGVPLLLPDGRGAEPPEPIRRIPHVEIIRIGTRVPVCLPMRITEGVAKMLRSYVPLYVVTHFNHPKEITPDARGACELLVDHGVPVENQMVLMRRRQPHVGDITPLAPSCPQIRVRHPCVRR